MPHSHQRHQGPRRGSPQPAQHQPKRFWLIFVVLGILVLGGIVSVFMHPRPTSARLAQPVQAVPAVAPSDNNQNGAPKAAAPTPAPQTNWTQSRSDASQNAGRPLVQAQDGLVRISLADLTGREARFYAYQDGNKAIPFFVMRSSDGVIRAAFDACDVCFAAKKGYHQDGDEMVCNNCGSRFPSAKINEVEGGCNPSPLQRTVQGDDLIIKVTDLASGAKYF